MNSSANQLIAVKSTATVRRLQEIRHGETGGGDSHREEKFVAVEHHLYDVEPEEEHLHTYAAQIADPPIRYHSSYNLLVSQVVRLDRKAAGSVHVRGELAGFFVQFVPGYSFREQALGQTVLLKNFVC